MLVSELLVVVDHVVARRVEIVALRLLDGDIAGVGTEKRVGLLAFLNLFILHLGHGAGHNEIQLARARVLNQGRGVVSQEKPAFN